MIKHVDFQLYRVHPGRVILKKLTTVNKYMNKRVWLFINQRIPLSGVEKKKLFEHKFWLYMIKQDVLTSISEISKNVYLFVSLSWLVSFGVCINMQYFFDTVRNKAPKNKYIVNQKKIKNSRKEHVMWASFKFWPMKNIFRKL